MRQSLDRFLPEMGRGFMIRGSAAYTNLKGRPAGGDFNQLRDTRYTLAVNYARGRLNANVGYIMNGRQVNNGAISSNGFTAEQVYLPDNMVDFNLTYSLMKHVSLFLSGSNVTDERKKREDQYEQTPRYARESSSNTYGITYTVGLSGSF